MDNYFNIDILEDDIFNEYPSILKLLLKDKTTRKNILWATNEYIQNGDNFKPEKQIFPIDITGSFFGIVIQPRAVKPDDVKKRRIKDKGEVFTPTWICNEQNNKIDEEWFNRKNVFNISKKDKWITKREKVEFSPMKNWKKYVDAKRLEITCGEAPYLVSRYDASSGDIIPVSDRIGILDRKLRIVNENTETEQDWIKWATRAVQSTYGYEYQGDSLLIARENLLYSFMDYYEARFNKKPEYKVLKNITNIITWNIWQMDGVKNIVPFSVDKENPKGIYCKIMDWRDNNSILFVEICDI